MPLLTHTKSAVKDLCDMKSHEIIDPKPKVRLDLGNPVRSRPKKIHSKEQESSLVPGRTDTTQSRSNLLLDLQPQYPGGERRLSAQAI